MMARVSTLAPVRTGARSAFSISGCWVCVSAWASSAANWRSRLPNMTAQPSMCGYRCEGKVIPGPVRILMVDDHPVVLAGLKALVSADPALVVVGEARDGRTALRMAKELVPGVVVL